MPDRRAGDGEGDEVGLDEGGGHEGPGVDERHGGDEGEVGDHQVGHWALDVDGEGEEGLEGQQEEEGAGDGGEVEAECHGGRELVAVEVVVVVLSSPP